MRKKYQRRSSRNIKKAKNIKIILLVLLTSFVSIILYNYIINNVNTPKKDDQTSTKRLVKEKEKIEFTFHEELLKNEKVIKIDKGKKNKRKSFRNKVFQIGSFQKESDAETLKVNLALIGLISEVNQVQLKKNKSWYRVRVYPHKNNRNPDEILSILEKNQFKYILLNDVTGE